MFRSAIPTLKNCPISRYRIPYFPLRSLASKDSSKPTAADLADRSKVFLRAFQEISSSNEVKLVRLATIRIVDETRTLFQKHVLESPTFKASMIALKARLEQMQLPTETIASSVKSVEGNKQDEKIETKVESTAKIAKTEKVVENPK